MLKEILKWTLIYILMVGIAEPALQTLTGSHYDIAKSAVMNKTHDIGRFLIGEGRRVSIDDLPDFESWMRSFKPKRRMNTKPWDTWTPPSDMDVVEARSNIVASARALVGSRYVWGGERQGAVDCSGVVVYSFRKAGMDVPHRSKILSTLGQKVPLSELQPGDLIFFRNAQHVGIYVGDGKVIHASTGRRRVVIDKVKARDRYLPISGARRLLSDQTL
ncbi:C40 family peptidase [Myxococcota bacterium]|nr:C40 family peptidase [Myxococcota bacterium]